MRQKLLINNFQGRKGTFFYFNSQKVDAFSLINLP